MTAFPQKRAVLRPRRDAWAGRWAEGVCPGSGRRYGGRDCRSAERSDAETQGMVWDAGSRCGAPGPGRGTGPGVSAEGTGTGDRIQAQSTGPNAEGGSCRAAAGSAEGRPAERLLLPDAAPLAPAANGVTERNTQRFLEGRGGALAREMRPGCFRGYVFRLPRGYGGQGIKNSSRLLAVSGGERQPPTAFAGIRPPGPTGGAKRAARRRGAERENKRRGVRRRRVEKDPILPSGRSAGAVQRVEDAAHDLHRFFPRAHPHREIGLGAAVDRHPPGQRPQQRSQVPLGQHV